LAIVYEQVSGLAAFFVARIGPVFRNRTDRAASPQSVRFSATGPISPHHRDRSGFLQPDRSHRITAIGPVFRNRTDRTASPRSVRFSATGPIAPHHRDRSGFLQPDRSHRITAIGPVFCNRTDLRLRS
jgi:hypothetical protein